MFEDVENWLSEKMSSVRQFFQATDNAAYKYGLLVVALVALIVVWYFLYSKTQESAWYWIPILLITAASLFVLSFGLAIIFNLLGTSESVTSVGIKESTAEAVATP